MKVILEGLGVYDGEYPLNLSEGFTHRELHVFKTLAGLRIAELEEAMEAGDPDLPPAFAVIALLRNERIRKTEIAQISDAIMDMLAGKITLDFSDESDARPPEVTQTGFDLSGAPAENAESSTPSTNGTGDDLPATILASTGSPGSQPGSTSAPRTSAT